MESTGLILQLYRNHFGTLPLQLADHFGDLDIAAALTADGTVLTVGAVNPTDSPITLDLNSDQDLPDSATRWHVGGHDQHDHNVPGHSRVLDIQMTPKMSIHSGLEVPALSSAIFRFDLR